MYATEEQARILREAVAEIKKHPETFDMREWVSQGDCGTVCCLAGQIACNAVSADEWKRIAARRVSEWDTEFHPVPKLAADALGVPFDDEWPSGDMGRLFFIGEWPRQFVPEIVCTCGWADDDCDCIPKPTPEQLEARVEWWIEHGE